jgi:hypothetical protein
MSGRKEEFDRALAVLREHWPEKAAEVDRLLAADPDRVARGDIKLSIGVRYTLEKFDGDYQPGMEPVEVIEGEDVLAKTGART